MPHENHAGDGILAIWHNCAPDAEETFERWYQGEHLLERVSIPGFLYGRRYEGQGYRTYFTYYQTDSPDVLISEAYQTRVNDPTPLTAEVMDGVFMLASRTVCRRVATAGAIHGGVLVTGVSQSAPDAERWGTVLASAIESLGGAHGEVWQAIDGASDIGSREQQIRGADETIGACIAVSVLREADAAGVVDWMQEDGIDPVRIGTYRLLCELRANELSNL